MEKELLMNAIAYTLKYRGSESSEMLYILNTCSEEFTKLEIESINSIIQDEVGQINNGLKHEDEVQWISCYSNLDSLFDSELSQHSNLEEIVAQNFYITLANLKLALYHEDYLALNTFNWISKIITEQKVNRFL